MKRRLNVNKVRVSKLLIAFILLFFVIVIARLLYLGISPKIDGIDLKTFVANRNTRKKTTYAKRGTIYDSSSNVLARTINSYTVIAYLVKVLKHHSMLLTKKRLLRNYHQFLE